MMELAGKLKMQQLQGILADKWRPYMENLDTMCTDTTCYESEMRYPTDTKLLWKVVEKNYATMCELSGRLILRFPQFLTFLGGWRTQFVKIVEGFLEISSLA